MAASAPVRLDAAVVRVGAVVSLGMLMSILDVSVVNVALPRIQESFGAGPGATLPHAYASWTVTAYALALASAIPVAGWAGDRFGAHRMYVTALAIFTAGSALCALSGSMTALIAMRVVQGVGGGMLLPLGMTILARAAGPERMGRLAGLLGLPVLLGPLVGPLLGGWLVGTASWRWIFLVNLPLGLTACWAAVRFLPRSDQSAPAPLDLRGLLLMCPGLALCLLGISSLADTASLAAPFTVLALSTGTVLVLCFLVHVGRAPAPLVDPRILLRPDLRLPALVLCLFQGAFFGALVLVPTFLQQVRAEPVETAALLLLPQGFGALLSMPLAGALSDRLPAIRISAAGLTLVSAGLTGLALLGATAPYQVVVPGLFVMGLGMGATVVPTTIAALRALRHEELARGSSLLTAIQQMASSAGMAVLSTYLTSLLSHGVHPGDAFARVFSASAGLVALTALLAGVLPLRGRALPQQR